MVIGNINFNSLILNLATSLSSLTALSSFLFSSSFWWTFQEQLSNKLSILPWHKGNLAFRFALWSIKTFNSFVRLFFFKCLSLMAAFNNLIRSLACRICEVCKMERCKQMDWRLTNFWHLQKQKMVLTKQSALCFFSNNTLQLSSQILAATFKSFNLTCLSKRLKEQNWKIWRNLLYESAIPFSVVRRWMNNSSAVNAPHAIQFTF